MLWVDSVNKLISEGIEATIECGPGKVLVGLNKRINKDAAHYTVNDVASLDKTLEELA